MSRFGRFNGPTLAKHRERVRRMSQHCAEVDERDVGILGAARVALGFDEESTTYWLDGYPASAADYFRTMSNRWLKRSA